MQSPDEVAIGPTVPEPRSTVEVDPTANDAQALASECESVAATLTNMSGAVPTGLPWSLWARCSLDDAAERLGIVSRVIEDGTE